MKDTRRIIMFFCLLSGLIWSGKVTAMQVALPDGEDGDPFTLIAQHYEALDGFHGAPIDWENGITQYIEANPSIQTIDPLTQTSPLSSAYMYIPFFPQATFPNRNALLFVILTLIMKQQVPLYNQPVVATYEPPRLKFLREIQKQLEPK